MSKIPDKDSLVRSALWDTTDIKLPELKHTEIKLIDTEQWGIWSPDYDKFPELKDEEVKDEKSIT